MGDLSAHFDRSEFLDHRTHAMPYDPDPKLIQALERLRSIDGKPLRIVSGYRSPETNRSVGGAPQSQHLYNRAADLVPGRFTVAQALHCGAVGVGYSSAGWVVHIDTRPAAPVTFRDGP